MVGVPRLAGLVLTLRGLDTVYVHVDSHVVRDLAWVTGTPSGRALGFRRCVAGGVRFESRGVRAPTIPQHREGIARVIPLGQRLRRVGGR